MSLLGPLLVLNCYLICFWGWVTAEAKSTTRPTPSVKVPSLAQTLMRMVKSIAPKDPRLSTVGQLSVEDAEELLRQVDGFMKGIRYQPISPAPEPGLPTLEKAVQTAIEVQSVAVQANSSISGTKSIGIQTLAPLSGKSHHTVIFQLTSCLLPSLPFHRSNCRRSGPPHFGRFARRSSPPNLGPTSIPLLFPSACPPQPDSLGPTSIPLLFASARPPQPEP